MFLYKFYTFQQFDVAGFMPIKAKPIVFNKHHAQASLYKIYVQNNNANETGREFIGMLNIKWWFTYSTKNWAQATQDKEIAELFLHKTCEMQLGIKET